jgi:hypothetical protein
LEICIATSFLIPFSKSPYALSVSFLKDKTLLGKPEAKYDLNLDEKSVNLFYDRLDQHSIVQKEDPDNDQLSPIDIFDDIPFVVKEMIESV